MNYDSRQTLWVDLARWLASRPGYSTLRIRAEEAGDCNELRVYLRSIELDAALGHYVYVTATGGVGATRDVPARIVRSVETRFDLVLVTDRASEDLSDDVVDSSWRLH